MRRYWSLWIVVLAFLFVTPTWSQTTAPAPAPAKKAAVVAPAPKAAPVVKEVVKEKIVEVPGPERVVIKEKIVEVPTMPDNVKVAIVGLISALIVWGAAKLAFQVEYIRTQFPSLIPVITAGVGMLVGVAQKWLAQAGWPVPDFGPILGLFVNGGGAMLIGTFFAQRRREKAATRATAIAGARPALSADGGPV